MARRTLAGTAVVQGIGLHTGARGDGPLPSGAPRARASSSGGPTSPGAPPIPARLAEVQSTERRTALGQGEASVQTVEHLLAAAAALAARRPDGRARRAGAADRRRLVRSRTSTALAEAGIAEQPGEPVVYRVTAPFQLDRGRLDLRGGPGASGSGSRPRSSGPIRSSAARPARYDITPDEFARELARARTFGFLREAEALRARGLALGAALESTLVLVRGRPGRRRRSAGRTSSCGTRRATSWATWRWSAAGSRPTSIATKPSHQGNIALARWLTRTAQRDGGVAMDIGKILDVIPAPVSRSCWWTGSSRSRGPSGSSGSRTSRSTSRSSRATSPAIRSCPACSSSRRWRRWAACCCSARSRIPEQKVVYFMSLDNVKFRRPVLPGRPAPLRARDAAEPRARPAG